MDNTTNWGHFGQNVGILPPPGFPIYIVTFNYFVINHEHIPTDIVLKLYCCVYPTKILLFIIFIIILVPCNICTPKLLNMPSIITLILRPRTKIDTP